MGRISAIFGNSDKIEQKFFTKKGLKQMLRPFQIRFQNLTNEIFTFYPYANLNKMNVLLKIIFFVIN
jgi:hypothetical protein